MNEEIIIWQFTVAMVVLTVGCTLYSMGGYRGKWKRRFVGSFILSAGFNGICAWRGLWSPWLLTAFPALITTFCLPYGADTVFPKVIKRTSLVLAWFQAKFKRQFLGIAPDLTRHCWRRLRRKSNDPRLRGDRQYH